MDDVPRDGTATSPISTHTVSGFDEMQKAFAIRAAVYVGEQGRPYEHEFDGNDFHATHVLATVNDEPAGTCRIRYFGDFVKPERLCVLPRFRQKRYGAKGVAHAVARHAFDFCARKGFRRVYGHALRHLVRFWADFGTAPMNGGEFSFEEYRCVAMSGALEPPAGALHLHSDPLVLIRREGAWDRPGVLESHVA